MSKRFLKIVLGGILGGIGMLFAKEFDYTGLGWNYHIPFFQYIYPLVLGGLIGSVRGITDKSIKKLVWGIIITGLTSVLGHYLWRCLYESKILGESMIILALPLISIMHGSFIAFGISLSRIISESKHRKKEILDIIPRGFTASLVCLLMLFMGFAYWRYYMGNIGVFIYGFGLGMGSYLIGEGDDG